MWTFTFHDIPSAMSHQEIHASWQEAFTAMTQMIDLIHSPVSYNSLKTVCENIPIDNPTSFSDGASIFSISIST